MKEASMSAIHSVPVDLTVVLGDTQMPIQQLLRLGRGAVIELDAMEGDDVRILANNVPIATGEVFVQGEALAVTITSKLRSPD